MLNLIPSSSSYVYASLHSFHNECLVVPALRPYYLHVVDFFLLKQHLCRDVFLYLLFPKYFSVLIGIVGIASSMVTDSI